MIDGTVSPKAGTLLFFNLSTGQNLDSIPLPTPVNVCSETPQTPESPVALAPDLPTAVRCNSWAIGPMYNPAWHPHTLVDPVCLHDQIKSMSVESML